VSAEDVDAYFERVHSSLQACTSGAQSFACHLHLGVHGRAQAYHLEARGYNNCSFRVPDQRGWQPEGLEIDLGRGLDAWRGPALDLEWLSAALCDRGHVTEVSEDAGTYVCNYTLFRSCMACSETERVVPVFVHVPPLDVACSDEQYRFLLDCMLLLAEAVLKSGVGQSTVVGKGLAGATVATDK
jgi:pyrrolidone-carboxylate peptidase